MEDKHLISGERIISQSNGNIITLTNLRIRYVDKQLGKAHIISIMLNKVSSVEVKYRSKIILLMLAILGFLAAFYGVTINESEFAFLMLIIGVLFLVAYFETRKHILAVRSDGGKEILFHSKGMSHNDVLHFINHIEERINENTFEKENKAITN